MLFKNKVRSNIKIILLLVYIVITYIYCPFFTRWVDYVFIELCIDMVESFFENLYYSYYVRLLSWLNIITSHSYYYVSEIIFYFYLATITKLYLLLIKIHMSTVVTTILKFVYNINLLTHNTINTLGLSKIYTGIIAHSKWFILFFIILLFFIMFIEISKNFFFFKKKIIVLNLARGRHILFTLQIHSWLFFKALKYSLFFSSHFTKKLLKRKFKKLKIRSKKRSKQFSNILDNYNTTDL